MLERLTLNNFKSIKNGIFDFENLTLLSGLNGMGKSSILQSMLLLRQSYEKHLLPNIGISLMGEYACVGNGKDLLYSGAEDEFIDIDLAWTDSNLNCRFSYQENSDVQPIDSRGIVEEGTPYNEALFTANFQYLSAERISPKSIYDVSEYAVNQKRSLGVKGEYTAHFLAEHGDRGLPIKSLKHNKSVTDNLIDNLNAWMSEITPGTKVLAKLIPEINKASLHYQFSSSTELTQPFRPENTGFGLTYVLPVVTAILSAKPGDLLFIENPESHLHPAGQSVVTQLICLASNNGVQIIVETHSDHVLNSVRTSVKDMKLESDNVRIYFLCRDFQSSEHHSNIEGVRVEPTGRIDHWPPGFFDEWDKSLSKLIERN